MSGLVHFGRPGGHHHPATRAKALRPLPWRERQCLSDPEASATRPAEAVSVRINVSARAAYLAGVVLLLGEFAVAHIAHTLMRNVFAIFVNGFGFHGRGGHHLLNTCAGRGAWRMNSHNASMV